MAEVALKKIGTYRGVGIYYSAEHDTYNAINDAGRWLADGCVTGGILEECTAQVGAPAPDWVGWIPMGKVRHDAA